MLHAATLSSVRSEGSYDSDSQKRLLFLFWNQARQNLKGAGRNRGGSGQEYIYFISSSNIFKEVSSIKTRISHVPSVNVSFSNSQHCVLNHSDIFHLEGISQNSLMNQRLPVGSRFDNSSQEKVAPSHGSSLASNMTSSSTDVHEL